ncbi:MAG: hypothetical protein DDT23_00846 [candidate division WS2 bacterium]|nr:hypothetical protein [Candidatus Lithacetigena glycinireducens]
MLTSCTQDVNIFRQSKGSKVKESKVKEVKEINMCDFDLFWKTYPKKVNKAYAIKVWNKLKPSQELVDTIISAVNRAKKSDEWRKDKGQFIPHPSTYLNNKRWEDELTINEDAGKYAKYDRGEWEDEFSTNEEEGGKYDKYN